MPPRRSVRSTTTVESPACAARCGAGQRPAAGADDDDVVRPGQIRVQVRGPGRRVPLTAALRPTGRRAPSPRRAGRCGGRRTTPRRAGCRRSSRGRRGRCSRRRRRPRTRPATADPSARRSPAVDVHPQPAAAEAGVEARARGEVVGAPGPLVERHEVRRPPCGRSGSSPRGRGGVVRRHRRGERARRDAEAALHLLDGLPAVDERLEAVRRLGHRGRVEDQPGGLAGLVEDEGRHPRVVGVLVDEPLAEPVDDDALERLLRRVEGRR